jgi:hypothetical protein
MICLLLWSLFVLFDFMYCGKRAKREGRANIVVNYMINERILHRARGCCGSVLRSLAGSLKELLNLLEKNVQCVSNQDDEAPGEAGAWTTTRP